MDAAAAQEAQWLQVQAPAPCAAHELQQRQELFLGVFWQQQLCGAVAAAPDEEPGQTNITLLVVHPKVQRRGMARALLAAVLTRDESGVFVVTVAALNAPALALYKAFGFVPYRQGQLGPESLPVLQLRRPAWIVSTPT